VTAGEGLRPVDVEAALPGLPLLIAAILTARVEVGAALGIAA